MLESWAVPEELSFVRSTPRFDRSSVPDGLLRAHRVAPGVWGLLRVHVGSVTFVLEGTGERRTLHAGDVQAIRPDVLHHVEPDAEAEFSVEFYR